MRSNENPWTTRLGHAVLSEDLGLLLEALEEGDNPNEPAFPIDWTIHPLGLALLVMNNTLVFWMLRYGAHTNVIYEDAGGFGKGHCERCTPLFLAEYTDNRAAQRLLLRMGADPTFAARSGIGWETFRLPGFRALGSCPSWRAFRAMKGRIPVNELALKLQAVPNLDGGNGRLVATACGLQRLDYLALLVAQGADLSAHGSFHELAGTGTAIAARLLELGFDLNLAYAIDPLSDCCFAGRHDLVSLLLVSGANPNGASSDLQDPMGTSPLGAAIEAGDEKCIELLLDAGAEVEDCGVMPSQISRLSDSDVRRRLVSELEKARDVPF
ncbi:MAG: ankyrin repeat domain-containing protein [Opitutaceae bacterium]|nr:ankyrin repeat domain-containing protein [Opitutaceae bacterium]